MYTIKRAAALVGISAATLRAWERRYGIVSPSRTDGGYRLYGEDDLRALTLMARLVSDGWTPSLAAAETRRRLEAAPPPATDQAIPPASPRPGTSDLGEAVVNAAATLDAAALAAALDQLFALGSYEMVVDQHLLPAMNALGDAWAVGRVSVAGEHLTAHAVMRRLSAAYEAAAPFGGGRRVLVGLPPGARHEVGVLAFAVAARRCGLTVEYLGADLPVPEWVTAVAERDPAAVVLAVPTPEDVSATGEVLSALHAARPSLVVAVGGRAQDELPPGAVRLGHRIGSAARALARLVGPQQEEAAAHGDR